MNFLLPLISTAHEGSEDRLKIEVTSDASGSIAKFIFELPVETAEQRAKITESTLTEKSAARLAPQLSKALIENGELTARDGVHCTWDEPKAFIIEHHLTLMNQAFCPGKAGSLRWRPNAPETRESSAVILGNLKWDGLETLFTIEPGNTEVLFRPNPPPPFSGFVFLGMNHIGATLSQWKASDGSWHLPEGIDHILFVLALVLGGGGVVAILKTITGFTLGHSISLTLATLGVVTPPSKWVECSIALSIAFMAFQNLQKKEAPHRFWLTTGFGLIHGFGFASALQAFSLAGPEILSALFGFNIGVEIGQGVFVLLFTISILALNKSGKGRITLQIVSMEILGLGLAWFFQRALN